MIVAILTPRAGSMDAFREYETKAAGILARHGGAIERIIAEEPSSPDKPVREIHIVSFPDRLAFERYRADPELLSLRNLRAASIAHTDLIFGHDGPDFL